MRTLANTNWSVRLFCLLGLTIAAAGVMSVIHPSPAAAQNKEADPEQDPAPAAKADDGGGAAKNADGGKKNQDTQEEAKKKPISWLQWLWKALGPIYMLVFLALSFTLVALFVMNLLTARRENVCPVTLLDGFEQHLNEKQYQEAYELAKSDESFLGL